MALAKLNNLAGELSTKSESGLIPKPSRLRAVVTVSEWNFTSMTVESQSLDINIHTNIYDSPDTAA